MQEELLMQPLANNRLVFVVGNSRSGTTMMGRIIGRNHDVFTFSELHFYGQLYDPTTDKDKTFSKKESINLFSKLLCLQREGYFSQCNRLEKYHSEALTNLIDSEYSPEKVYTCFLDYESARNNKVIPCEQTPRNLFFLESIQKLHYDTKIINMIRDPRDVLLSQKSKWKRRFLGAGRIPIREALRAWINYHPITISLLWNSSVNEIEKFEHHDNVVSVKFEDVLEDPERSLKMVTNFLDINFNNSMLDIPQVGSSDRMDTKQRGINKLRKHSWSKSPNKYRTSLYLCERICGLKMQKYGYHQVAFKPNFLFLVLLYLTFPVKAGLAILLNIKRAKNITNSIRQRIFF